jgi:hypothetical protein
MNRKTVTDIHQLLEKREGIMIRKSGGSFIGCSKMARCKAPESPRTEAY